MLQNKTQVETVNFSWAFFLFMRVIFFHLTKFLLDCKKNEAYPKFVRWKNITRMKRKKVQARSLHLLLNITNRFACICLTSGYMSNAFSLRCIHLSCKVLYFIVSDDDFEITSKIYSFNLRLVLKHILHS